MRDFVTIRAASPDDVAELFRVRTSVRENHQSEEQLSALGITRDSVAALLRSGEAQAWCAEVDGAIVGFSMARLREGELFALFVLPSFEDRGIGTRFLDAAVDWLRARGPRPVRLSTGRETKAFRFYIARGWREAGSLEGGDPILELSD